MGENSSSQIVIAIKLKFFSFKFGIFKRTFCGNKVFDAKFCIKVLSFCELRHGLIYW